MIQEEKFGFDCEFVSKPPEVLQTHCPVCLLILCEPYQVTCCGKSFCKGCTGKIEASSQPCPTCKQDKFESYHNKGLQQPLYGFAVFCSNKERGCVWEGELGQLDQHINSNPDKEKQLVGCAYTNIACLFCDKLHPRLDMEQHQASLCPKRPFTCFMCEEYESTYEDVVNSHAHVCKCRSVECPNSCGADNLQHQHVKKHVSSQCPLTYVECEFSDAGCDAMVCRKDLASHLTANLVTHMSLLAIENAKLKQQHKELARLMKEHSDSLVMSLPLSLFGRVPLDLLCPARIAEDGGLWLSEPFYDQIGGDKLELQCLFQEGYFSLFVARLANKFQVRNVKKVTIVLIDQEGSQNESLERDVVDSRFLCSEPLSFNCARFCKNGHVVFCVIGIQY